MEEDKEKAPEEEAVSEEDLESEKPQEEEESEEPKEESEEEEEEEESFEEKQDDRKMYKATCAECGKECEVPFKPEEGRDVFCDECFRKRRRPQRRFGGRGGFNRSGGFRRERRMYDATCAECGKECQVPFKPSGDKPVLCKECYMKKKESER